MRRSVQILIAAAAAGVMASAALDAIGESGPVKREIIPGSELMTPQERERYRQRMRTAKTPEAEAQVRDEHLRQVRERARLRGLRVPDPDEKNRDRK